MTKELKGQALRDASPVERPSVAQRESVEIPTLSLD